MNHHSNDILVIAHNQMESTWEIEKLQIMTESFPNADEKEDDLITINQIFFDKLIV